MNLECSLSFDGFAIRGLPIWMVAESAEVAERKEILVTGDGFEPTTHGLRVQIVGRENRLSLADPVALFLHDARILSHE